VGDMTNATGEKPGDVKLTGSKIITLDYTLPRAAAAEMKSQLSDPRSWLMTKVKLRTHYGNATLEAFEPLGVYLNQRKFSDALHKELGKTADVNEVTGTGDGDSGVIAIACPRKESKRVRKYLEGHLKKLLNESNWEFAGEVTDYPDTTNVKYAVDIVSNGLVDRTAVLENLNSVGFDKQLDATLAQRGEMNGDVVVQEKATSRSMQNLSLELRWDFPKPGQEDFLDGICMVYAGAKLAEVVDFASGEVQQKIYDGDEESPGNVKRALAINRSVQHSGDVMSETGGKHTIMLKLDALPASVTDLFFVLSAFDCEDLSLFLNPETEIYDTSTGNKLTEYMIAEAGKTQALIMTQISRRDGPWIVNNLGLPTDGRVGCYDPIRQTIGNIFAERDHWERRGHLVKMKVLLKTGRMVAGPPGPAQTMWQNILELPLGVFQRVLFNL